MLSSQEVIGIVIATCVFFWGLFSFRRFSGIKSNTRLYLRQKSSGNLATNEAHAMDAATVAASKELGQIDAGAKNLNVLFMYNGHSFEAHEILGIPAGANPRMIEEAYQKQSRSVAPESLGFIDAAYRVLKAENKKH